MWLFWRIACEGFHSNPICTIMIEFSPTISLPGKSSFYCRFSADKQDGDAGSGGKRLQLKGDCWRVTGHSVRNVIRVATPWCVPFARRCRRPAYERTCYLRCHPPGLSRARGDVGYSTIYSATVCNILASNRVCARGNRIVLPAIMRVSTPSRLIEDSKLTA